MKSEKRGTRGSPVTPLIWAMGKRGEDVPCHNSLYGSHIKIGLVSEFLNKWGVL
jgi:hypothetical protein